MATHTPGPWKADPNRIFDYEGIFTVFIWGPNGDGFGRVAMTYAEYGNEDELMPNAYLIAAAPDLLEAAQRLLNLEDESGGRAFPTKDDIAFARLAIAKAKGE